MNLISARRFQGFERRLLWIGAWLTAAAFMAPALPVSASDYARVTGPCALVFPRDHGAHPDYKTEWWYYTGNVATPAGRRMGFQLTFFRSRIVPPGGGKDPPARPSAWRTDTIILGHAAVSDLSGGRFFHDRDAARNALGMAGIATVQDRTVVMLKKWSATIGPEHHRLSAETDDFGISLVLRPEKPPVLHGDNGYSRKGTAPDRASCYYSFTRLAAEGTLTIEGKAFPVAGAAWMDHEFSTAPLAPGLVGWDWFSLQLSDGTEVMIYLLRRRDGSFHPASSGTFVDRDGGSRHLGREDIRVSPAAFWKSPHSGAVYPSKWRIDIAPLALRLAASAALSDQEMADAGASEVVYWEGSVSLSGSRAETPVTGAGYVEMTGYAGPLDVLN